MQLDLHLVDGLLSEVADVEQIGLGTADKLTDGVNTFALEAVVGTDRQVQVLDGQSERSDVIGLGGRGSDLDAFCFDVQLTGQAEELNQGLARRSERVPSGDGVLGFHIEHEPIEVGALLDAGGLHLVGDLEHRRVDRVDRDTADLGAGRLVLDGGDVAATALDDELDLQLSLVVQGGDVQIRVVHGDAGRGHDVACGHSAGAACGRTW